MGECMTSSCVQSVVSFKVRSGVLSPPSGSGHLDAGREHLLAEDAPLLPLLSTHAALFMLMTRPKHVPPPLGCTAQH